jgi:hypothetical protein
MSVNGTPHARAEGQESPAQSNRTPNRHQHRRRQSAPRHAGRVRRVRDHPAQGTSQSRCRAMLLPMAYHTIASEAALRATPYLPMYHPLAVIAVTRVTLWSLCTCGTASDASAHNLGGRRLRLRSGLHHTHRQEPCPETGEAKSHREWPRRRKQFHGVQSSGRKSDQDDQ